MPDGGGPMQSGRPPRPDKCVARALVQQQRQNLHQQQQQERQQRQEQGEAELLWSLSSVDLSQAKLVMDSDCHTANVADLSSPNMADLYSVRDPCVPAASPSPTASLASLLTSPFGSPSFASPSPFAASAFSFSPSASSSSLSASASSLTSSAVSLGQRVSSAVLAGAQQWCVALAEEALRLADDFARGDILSAGSPKSKAGGLEQLPQRLWRRCFQYRRLVLAATAVFLVNSIFSFLLFESLLGGAHLCAWGRCSPPPLHHHSSAAAYDIASLDPPHRPSPSSSSRTLSSSPSARTLSSIPLSSNSSSKSDQEAQTSDTTSSSRQVSSSQQVASASSSSSSQQSSSDTSIPTLSSQPADDAFINELAESWDVNPYTGIPRAYLLRRRAGPRHHRALLLQDACYLFAGGSGKEHDGRHTGVWFDADALADAVALGASPAQRQKRGTGSSGISAAAVDGRELSRINLVSELVAAADREAKVAKSSRQDLNAARRRVERTVGEFVGPTGLARYVLSSSPTAKRLLRGWKQQDPEYVGVVAGFESTLGSASTHAVFLSDVVGTGSPSWQSAAVFFPGDKKVRSEWAVGALRAAVGERVAAVPGQVEGQPLCFRNVMFTLVHGPPSLEEIVSFRHKADPGLALPGPSPSLSSQPLVTMLVNPEGEAESASEHRPQRIANLPEVQAAIQRTFPHLNVKILDAASASFAESMSLLQHTALLVTPHGCPKGLVLSLPRGASVLELFPYHFTSDAIHIMSALAGVKHFKWESAQAADGVYEESCLAKGKYAALTAADCRRKRDCLFCVRDRVSTRVDVQQLQKVLAEAKLAVDAFLKSSVVQSA